MSDPVADKSGFLRMYMSNHPDTLVAYVKHFGKVQEVVTSAEMTAIDSKSMTLTYVTKGGKKVAVVPINPPLASYDDVKPRLLEMKAQAQEALGMIKVPQLPFHFPWKVWHTAILMGLLVYTTYVPENDPSPIFTFGRMLRAAVGGFFTLKCIWGFLVAAHTLEALYTLSLCRKHRTGILAGFGQGAYVILTVLFGFPVWKDMRQHIQAARIASVMKIQ